MNIKLHNFEGPYDLLLELVRQRKVDLSEVSLRDVVDQFLLYLQKHTIPTSIYADFVVVASTLLLLKLRQLMPKLSEDEADELQELTDRVRVYQLYRRQGLLWQRTWGKNILLGGAPRNINSRRPLPQFDAGDLLTAWHRLRLRIKPPLHPIRHLRGRRLSVSECMQEFSTRLRRAKTVVFTDMFDHRTKEAAPIAMLAMLELVRRQSIRVEQDELFGTITISNRV